jgi:hypothetical protein
LAFIHLHTSTVNTTASFARNWSHQSHSVEQKPVTGEWPIRPIPSQRLLTTSEMCNPSRRAVAPTLEALLFTNKKDVVETKVHKAIQPIFDKMYPKKPCCPSLESPYTTSQIFIINHDDQHQVRPKVLLQAHAHLLRHLTPGRSSITTKDTKSAEPLVLFPSKEYPKPTTTSMAPTRHLCGR